MVPAASATACVPTLTGFGPVVPPSPASAFCVTPSIWRLNRPGSVLGKRLFFTSSFPELAIATLSAEAWK